MRQSSATRKKGHIFGTLAKENMDTFMFTESIIGKPLSDKHEK